MSELRERAGRWEHGGGTSWAVALEQAQEERETGCAREKGKREWAEREEERTGGLPGLDFVFLFPFSFLF